MNPEPTSYYILCEGYFDRAFWLGWLEQNEWEEDSKDHPLAKDAPTGSYVQRKDKRICVITPCRGNKKTKVAMNSRLRHVREMVETKRANPDYSPPPQPLFKIIWNVDDDSKTPNTSAESRTQDSVVAILRQFEIDNKIEPTSVTGNSPYLFLDNWCEVQIVMWRVAEDTQREGAPLQQTLERLVCTAISAVYPQRAKNVIDWLDSRDTPPDTNPKEYAWSYMAGWYAERHCDAFYKTIWQDPKIKAELCGLLQAGGSWGIFEELAAIEP